MPWTAIAAPVRRAIVTAQDWADDDGNVFSDDDGNIWADSESVASGDVPDGAMTEGSGDGFYTPPRGDGVMVSDGDWTPIHLSAAPTAWLNIDAPVAGGVYLADGTYVADGSVVSGGSDWVGISVP